MATLPDSQPGTADYSRGIAACLAAALFWSSAGLFIKGVELPPLEIAALRALVSTAFFCALTGLLGGQFRHWPWVSIGAAAGMGLTAVSFVVATKWTTAAAAIFLQSTAPAWVLLLDWIVLRRPPRLRDLAAVAGCTAGLALFFVGNLQLAGLWGNVIALCSGLFFAVHTVCLRRVPADRQVPVLAVGNVIAACAAGCLAGSGLLERLVPSTLAWSWPTPAQWLCLAYLGGIQIGLGYFLFSLGLRRLPPIQVSLLVLLEPMLNPVWVYLGTGEAPGQWALVGGAVVLGTLAWHSLGGGERVTES
jgi:drug/metabolite transporter (DMT)-like permease